MEVKSIPRLELIQVAEAVSREKSIEKEEVILAMEEAIQKAARSKYGLERDIRANIDRKNGSIDIAQFTEVVENIENELTQMTFEESQRKNLNLIIGDFYKQSLPPIDFGRIAAQTAKQVISQKVREAERHRQYHEYKDRVGEIVVGTIKRVENHSITIDLGRAEATIKKDQMIPREQLKPGERLRCFIVEVTEETKGPQIFLSRASNQFLAALFTQEVPEIYDGIIEIKGVAREPGSRAKISAFSNDPSIDPVGACVGMRGSRVQAVVNELQGEKIDIVTWSDNQATFLANALAPAEVSKIFLYEEKNKVEVVIPDEQLSLAIGRKGQNVKLASSLTNLEIDILTEEEESERRQIEFKEKSAILIDLLDVEDVIAQLLVTEGYVTIESIVSETLENLEKIEGFDSDLASEILSRAKNAMQQKVDEDTKIINEKIFDEDLKGLRGMSASMLALLAKDDIVNLTEFADLASYELIDKEEGIFRKLELDEDLVNQMIMDAREKIFS